MRRREFVLSSISAAVLHAESEPRTLTYRTAGGCDIRADVHGWTEDVRSVAVWIHGGALISGSRRLSATSPVLRSLLNEKFRVISIDYRLAPETKLPAIIEDVQEAFRWIRSESKDLRVDTNRIAVCGGSAGGYLTLMVGHCVKPAPKALVSFWGYGDIIGDWYARPDPFYLKQPAVSREEALAAVGTVPLSDDAGKAGRGRYYLHLRQQGKWPLEVAGHEPEDERWFRYYCPVRNVTRSYPPTLLIHGTADTDVPHQQSVLMVEQLQNSGVPHEFVSVPEGGHGLGNIPAEERDRIYARAAAFLAKHVPATRT
jgi:acetyl esterase/lipase